MGYECGVGCKEKPIIATFCEADSANISAGHFAVLTEGKENRAVVSHTGFPAKSVFQNGKSEAEVHSMHGFNENKLKDTRRLWVADKLTTGNVELFGRAMDSLVGLDSGVQSGLETICGSLMCHVRR